MQERRRRESRGERRTLELLRRAANRLRAAARWPTSSEWLGALPVAAAYLLLALPIALAANLVEASERPEAAALVPLLFRVLVAPALLEEVLFRVVPNPHPDEGAPRGALVAAAVSSLAAYVLAHPLVGLLSGTPDPFTRPAFLLLTALLGGACLHLYRRSGSLWPPVALHWLVVSGWLAWGGEGLLPTP